MYNFIYLFSTFMHKVHNAKDILFYFPSRYLHCRLQIISLRSLNNVLVMLLYLVESSKNIFETIARIEHMKNNHKIKKSTINMILNAYSTVPKEFERVDEREDLFKSKLINGYYISIESEKREIWDVELNTVKKFVETGRIIVHHSSSNGKRINNDIWDKDKNGNYFWLCRNPQNTPAIDAEILRDMENELEIVRTAAKKLQEEHKNALAKITEQSEIIESLKNNRPIIGTRHKQAGRPKETEQQKEKAARIDALLKEGKTNIEIMALLKLKKSTYFRLKKLIE